jgi:hypothetical protein
MSSLLKQIQYEELKGFITNTNKLYSINNGPWPNTALQITDLILLVKRTGKIPLAGSNLYQPYII